VTVDYGPKRREPALEFRSMAYDYPEIRPPEARVISIRPGDAILVGRVLSFRAFIRSPIAWLISWRIQHSTGSPWNHVAAYMGGGWISEAEWNAGVHELRLQDFLSGDYRVAVVRPLHNDPARPFRGDQAVAFWRRHLSTLARNRKYSLRTLLLMRVAAVLFGPESIAKMIKNLPDDGAWICSEWVAVGWGAGGFWNETALVTPCDFARGMELLIEDPDEIRDNTMLEQGG
jgi:hypothetical protein